MSRTAGRLTIVLSLVLALPSLATARQAPADDPKHEAEINKALRARQYERAVELIDAALPDAEQAGREYLMFRRGLALLYAGRNDAAIEQFAVQLRDFPDGEWSHKARFRTADAHVALKQFEAAEKIYAERVRELIGDERKARQARVYLDFAEELFTPPDTFTKPDYNKALTFYERALELEPGESLRDDILLKRAQCNQKLQKWADAANQYEEYLLIFDPAFRELRKMRRAGVPLPPPAAKPGKHVVAVRFGLGECRLALSQQHDARRVWQDLLTWLDENDPKRETHRQAWIDATYLISRTHHFPQPPNGESLTLGVGVLEKLIKAHPGAEKSIQAAYDIGKAYAHLGRHDQAIAALRALIDRADIRPRDDKTRELAERLSQDALHTIGQLYLAQKKYGDAIGAWNQYVAKYPTGPHWSAAQRLIKDAEYQIGADAVQEKNYDAARQAWTAFLQKYPLDARAPAILFQFGSLLHKEKKWDDAIAQWRRLVNKYPQHEQAGAAQFMIGRTHEEKTGDLPAAIAAYRKLTWSPWAAKAQQRVAQMNATRLTLLTERTFRTDEPARVRVDLRNVDKLTVKLYRIDMHDYFRKSHGMRGVERLDLLLIDPDETIEVDVDGYEKYKPITQQVEIPFDGPGVYAVYVSNENSKATPERLEATTLLIRSDIDLIVKSSRRQLLVFAQDMRTQEPAAGVRVLVSDGKKIRFKGTTGDDGVWLHKHSGLRSLRDLSIFAQRDGHVAGNALSLQGLQFSSGLQPRGYIYTDRPAYQPGDAVNVRGILREIERGQYTMPRQPEEDRLSWKLDVVDAKGRVLRTSRIQLTEYGSFASQFRITADAPVGRYKLIARRAGGPSFIGTFNVQTYQLPKAFLRFDFDERFIMRGDKISGHIVAKYHYGEPLKGKPVEYQMHLGTGDVISRSGVTDKDGKIAFEFDSTMLPEEGHVVLSARQADMNLDAYDTIFVAVRAFRATVSTPRRLYLSDEPVEATITTQDLKGDPLAREMTLTAYLRTHDRGRWSETKVETAEVATDTKTGVGRASLKLTKGGQYVLRAEGKDRFGHLVAAEAVVHVSGEDDKTRLRIFSDRQHYKVGESIGVDVHSRIGEATKGGNDSNPSIPQSPNPSIPTFLALITFEGEEIIGYRTVRLNAGHNPLALAVAHEHFPNFAVGVSVMAGNRFHSASRAFTVERQLNISLKPDRETYRPRDEMTVEVTVTDQRGNPVQTEIGLAMIDNALLTRFPDATPNIVSFFQEGAQRTAAMRTETSCTFRYAAATRGMLTEILAEAQRMEDEKKWKALARAPMASRASVRTFALQHADAAAMVRALQNVVNGKMQSREGRILITADPQSNSLIVSATSDQLVEIQQWVSSLDSTAGVPNEPQSQVRRALNALGYMAEGGRGRRPARGGFRRGAGGGGNLFEDDADDNERDDEGEWFRFDAPRDSSGRFADKDARLGLADRLAAGEKVKQQVISLRAKLSKAGLGSHFKKGKFDLELGRIVRSAPPRSYFPEVAYWNPRIETDADGRATVKIVIPDNSTKWKLIARGVSRETLTGDGRAEVVSKHDFFVELLTPPSFVEGDRAVVAGRVHALVDYTGKVDVVLSVKRRSDEATERRRDQGDDFVISEQTRTIDVDGSGVYDVEFDAVAIEKSGSVVFELNAATRDDVPDAGRKLADAFANEIDVRPWGMRIESHASGVRGDSDFVEIELPATDVKLGKLRDALLTVAVGPSMQRWLIEEALESGPRWTMIERDYRSWKVAPPRSHGDTASALLGCLYAADYVRGQQATEVRPTEGGGRTSDGATKGSADLRLLNERIAGLAAQLLAAQNDDGGWAWTGTGKNTDPWTTSHVAWALGKAQRNGYELSRQQLSKLTAYLQQAFADARTGRTELKSVLLHGLAWAGKADFARANRLYRNRQSLSNAALSHLALTLVRLDRKPIAMELLALLSKRTKEVRLGRQVNRCLPAVGCSAWMNSELEVTAMALLAQLSVDPRAAIVKQMVDYLTSSIRSDGWRPHKARGTVIAALATWYAQGRQEAANYTLSVLVNGKEVRKITADDPGSVRFELSGDDLATTAGAGAGRHVSKQRIDFKFTGRGEYAFAVTLSGFSTRFPTPHEARNRFLFVLTRHVAPPPREYKGRTVTLGFRAVERYNSWRNLAEHLEVGKVAGVDVSFGRYDASENAAGDRDYIIVQETIPAGFRLLPGSLSGQFLAHDYSNNVLTLYYGSQRGMGSLRYQMVATTPGTYRLPPTVMRSLYRPDVYHLNASGQKLTVLPRGAENPDKYRLTPDELYNLGRLHFDDGLFEQATTYLRQLLDGEWVIRSDPYRETVRMLLSSALQRDKPDEIVDYFEILKERYLDLVIPFEQIVKVADAYARTGQHERAYIIQRATADASFALDSGIAGVLQSEGRFLESIDFLEALWREHPDTPQVESVYYATSQTLYGAVEKLASIRPRRGADGAAPLGRVRKSDIINETIAMLERFLSLYPESPIADEASYSLANAFLDLDDFHAVVRRTDELIELFPKSKWLDRYRYLQALALFSLGEFDRARELAQRVAAASYRDEQGVERPSPNRWLALYIIGQIYHAEKNTAKAIEYYKKVRAQFSDAKEAVELFEHKFIELPEVTVFHPDANGFREADEWQKQLRNRVKPVAHADASAAAEGRNVSDSAVRDAARSLATLYDSPFVRIDYRNVKSAVLQVYRVDLMKLALIEKNLTQITSVNLAGIKPIVETTVELGDGHDYVDKSRRVTLDLIKAAVSKTGKTVDGDAPAGNGSAEAGAYLVICRGDDLLSSGLVLVTPLAVELKEDLASQRSRVTVVNAIDRGGVKNVHVKVIGTSMSRFVSGETDLRGVYLADGINGFATAIARDAAGNFAFHRSEGAVLAMAATHMPPPPAAQRKAGKQVDYRSNLRLDNQELQRSNSIRLKDLFKRQQRGVEVRETQ